MRPGERRIGARGAAVGGLLILFVSATLGAGEEGAVIGSPVVDYDKPPKPVKMTRPQYPKTAFDNKIEGTVVVEILIDEKGRVHPQRVLTSIPALDAAAIATVKEWVFSPATKKGHAVATIAHAPIGFRIGKEIDHSSEPRPPSPTPVPPPDGSPQQSSIVLEAGSVVQPSPSAKPQLKLIGGLALDPKGADFTAWVNQWRNEVYRNWIVPPTAPVGFRGHTDIKFVAERDGSISSTRVLKSAGQPALDDAAVDALRKALFLPLPKAFHPARLTANVSFYYNEGPESAAPAP